MGVLQNSLLSLDGRDGGDGENLNHPHPPPPPSMGRVKKAFPSEEEGRELVSISISWNKVKGSSLTGTFSVRYVCCVPLRKKDSIKKQNHPFSQEKDFYVISVIGEDQVGIVSEVPQLPFKQGPNKEFSTVWESQIST
jgi:hypothetical protein